jgi:hypothetical protein
MFKVMIERTIIVIVSIAAIIFVPYWIGRFVMRSWFATDDAILSWAAGAIIVVILWTFLAAAIPYIINGSV